MGRLRALPRARSSKYLGVAAISTLLIMALLFAGCGSGATTTSSTSAATGQSTSRTLTTAFSFDQGSLDPDVWWDAEGISIILSAYQGLTRYEGAGADVKIVPSLATSWSESADGLTYTFHLRPNVHFHDGSLMTSTTWKYDLYRRGAAKVGPAYMVAPIGSMSTPDPLTLVVHMKHPESAFLAYLASGYGPKAVSLQTVNLHKTAADPLAEKWLANHDAGTGPYQLTKVIPGQSYVLEAYDGYWGPKPYYTTINISQIPSFTTQQLDLRSGTLNVMLHGVPPASLSQYKSNPALTVHMTPTIDRLSLWINPHLPPFNNQAVRLAAAQAINRAEIIPAVFGDTATVAHQIFTVGALPPTLGVYDPKYDPSVLKKLAAGLKDKHVDLAYTSDDPVNAQVAELIAQNLDAAGLQVTTRGVSEQTTFAWPTHPQGRANMVILPANPDDADGSSWATLFYQNSGGLSYFQPGVTAADNLINAGLRAVDPKTIQADYAKAADLYTQSGDFIPLCEENSVIVADSSIDGFNVDFTTQWTCKLWELHAK